jgi:hypothetical protein
MMQIREQAQRRALAAIDWIEGTRMEPTRIESLLIGIMLGVIIAAVIVVTTVRVV